MNIFNSSSKFILVNHSWIKVTSFLSPVLENRELIKSFWFSLRNLSQISSFFFCNFFQSSTPLNIWKLVHCKLGCHYCLLGLLREPILWTVSVCFTLLLEEPSQNNCDYIALLPQKFFGLLQAKIQIICLITHVSSQSKFILPLSLNSTLCTLCLLQ